MELNGDTKVKVGNSHEVEVDEVKRQPETVKSKVTIFAMFQVFRSAVWSSKAKFQLFSNKSF